MNIEDGIEVHHDGDLPARTGLGSSSSFTVGLLHSLYALKGLMPTKLRLATEAIHIERDILKEHVGSQDQISVAFGGFNNIIFNGNDDVKVKPIIMPAHKLQTLQDHMMFIFTGFSRFASDVAKKQIENTPHKRRELSSMCNMVDEAVSVLTEANDINAFGYLLHESWMLKRSLSDKITTPEIDDIYEVARKAGVIGGKLLGAGGGGFMLLFVEPEKQYAVKKALKKLLHVPFKFETSGSEIIFHRPYALK
jgi:D-glycero-alpha-D-manno-heptose-7-phosphate kinase